MNQANKRRMEISIETHSLTLIRTQTGKPTNLTYCQHCDKQAAVFRPLHATLIFRVDLTELERLLQNKQIHFARNGNLCGNSLATFFSR